MVDDVVHVSGEEETVFRGDGDGGVFPPQEGMAQFGAVGDVDFRFEIQPVRVQAKLIRLYRELFILYKSAVLSLSKY